MRSAEQILEFHLVKERLKAYALTELGRNQVENLTFFKERVLVADELAKTKEALRVVFAYSRMPIEFIHNIQLSLEKALKHTILEPLELYRIGSQARGIVQIKSFYDRLEMENIPNISYLVNSLSPCKHLKEEIDRCISSQLEILDSASPTLHRIRKEIQAKEAEVRRKLDSIIRSKADYLAETLITIRNDRLVIPVKSSHKNAVLGIIHDQSDSLQTVYIEPMPVVELNYVISRLKLQEKEEIERILTVLTNRVAEEYDRLTTNLEMITALDFMFAKGQFAKELDAYIPQLSLKQEIHLPRARHPLLAKEFVVANDYHLGGDSPEMMLITGPNTGGKTVGLKTIGLLTMMAQSGLAIPTNEGAIIGIFTQFFVDIGDDQSIAQSLSTFSSHMSKLITFVQKVDNHSLILLDEIGGGTNPNEGEAIAMALFDYFAQKQALVVATTHYSNLKSYALDKGIISITSMEFDDATMRPTYRLLQDVFGRSYAFEISRNLGLSELIINQAKRYKDYYASQIDVLSEKLDIQRIAFEKEKSLLEAAKNEFNVSKQELLLEQEKYKKLNQDLQMKAQEKVEEIIQDSLEKIEEIKATVLNNQDAKLHHYIQAKKQLETLAVNESVTHLDNSTFEVGDSVLVKSIKKVGKVQRKKGDTYVIYVNGISLQTSASDLELKTIQDKPELSQRKVSYLRNSGVVPLELHLIGLRVEEALSKLDKYLDDALAIHYKQVRIVHGHGTGALRKAVHEFLDNQAYVASYRLGGAGEGGLGATVVELK